MSDGRRHPANPTSVEFFDPMNSHSELHAGHCGLQPSIAAAMEGSAYPYHAHDSSGMAFEAMNPVGNDQISSGLTKVNAALHLNVGLAASQTQPLPLSVNTLSDAAHLMSEFQLESLIYGANAAQLMYDFYLETFNPADRINAAQLMQQFDLCNGYYSQQYL
ncbi:hypothetical protein N7478_012329 [Penicillium angulare]|uniref:uncharacterized protein n=1 Tax=Penicillium angulare TaxID=116970 RepID=UPI00254261BF|nr:uncharacterized protein N7478_012329 [Penicillium angulare]KAJ5259348.1 hypothetical protein N7478_012329 [Penicillium angulare]